MPEDTSVEMAQISPLGSPIGAEGYSGMPAFPNGTPFFYDAPHINGADLRGSDGESELSAGSDNGEELVSVTDQSTVSESFKTESSTPSELTNERAEDHELSSNQNEEAELTNEIQEPSLTQSKNIEITAET